jgi:hypothetical protein
VHGLDPRRPRQPRRLRRFGLRSLGVILTLCLAAMCTSAASPPVAHAETTIESCENAVNSSYQTSNARDGLSYWTSWATGFVNTGKCLFGGIMTGGHELIFGAAELLWEGVYGAGCGIKNLATWNGNSCTTSVADAGIKARTMLNDWADCIASFDVFSPGGVLGTLVAWDGLEEQELQYQVDQANDDMTASIQSVALAGGEKTLDDFVLSPGVQRAIANNQSIKLVLGRAIPGINALLVARAVAAECVDTTVAQLTAIEHVDHDLQSKCRFAGGRQSRPADRAACADNTLEDRYLTDDIIRRCISGDGFSVGTSRTTHSRQGHATTTSDVIEYEGQDAADVCSKVILPEARDRGMIDPDDLSNVNTLAPVAPPAAQELAPSAVPGGSTTGDCGLILRAIADGGSGSFTQRQRTTCTGTLDEECQLYRARIAIGRPSRFTSAQAARDMEDRCM